MFYQERLRRRIAFPQAPLTEHERTSTTTCVFKTSLPVARDPSQASADHFQGLGQRGPNMMSLL